MTESLAESGWVIEERDDVDWATYGFTDFARRRIVIRKGMTPGETHCTLVHELTHAERGPVPSEARSMEEAVVALISTARVIPAHALPELAERVAAEGEDAVADSLGVDPWTVEIALTLARAVAEIALPLDEIEMPMP